VNLGELAYPDVPEGAVHLLPLGATEPHGPHAPLSTDTLISVGICERAAERLAGEIAVLVLPGMPYGVTRYGSAFPGTVSITEETLRSLVTEIAGSVGTLVLVNSHFEPEQVDTLRSTGLPLLDLTRRRNAERLTEEFRSGSCHAGRYETSLVLADRPELVHAERMTALEERHVDMPAAIREGRTDFLAMGMDEAYCGAPAESSAEEGRATYDTLADMVVELIREVAA
jgi:creatinine amidohydrolase